MSADSLSSSPPPTRYFDLLPLELIRSIIEQLAPLEYTQETYQDRQRSLCSTCLVSRLFRSLAQPLLSKVIEVDTRQTSKWLGQIIESTQGFATIRAVEILVLKAESSEAAVAFNLGTLLAIWAHSLRDLRCRATSFQLESFYGTSEYSVVDATARAYLSRFADIKKLHLCDLDIALLPPLAFPQLSQLSLLNVELPSIGLDQSRLPALRHLALCHWCPYYVSSEVQSLSALAPQLCSMTLCSGPMRNGPPGLFNNPPSLSLMDLCHLSEVNLVAPHVKKIKFLTISCPDPLTSDGDDALQSCWKNWTNLINSDGAELPLQELHLPRSLCLKDSEPSQRLQAAVDGFIEVRRSRKIEVLFEDQAPPEALQSLLSEVFMRRSEVRRRVVEAGAKELGK